MYARMLEPQAPEKRHLAVAPHRPGAGSTWMFAILVAIAAAAVSGGFVYTWQHGKLDEGTALLSEMEARLDLAVDRIGVLQGQTAALSARLDRLVGNLGDVKAARGRLHEFLTEARSETERLRAQLIEARDEMASLLGRNDRLRALTGTRLPDGTHVARIAAVGAGQAPPRVVVKDVYQAPCELVALE